MRSSKVPASEEERDITKKHRILKSESATKKVASWMHCIFTRCQKGGMVEKRVGPQERGGKSAKRSEKRETNTIKMRGPKKAIVRSHNGEAQDRVDWKRDG